MSLDITSIKSKPSALTNPLQSAEAFAGAMRQSIETAEPQSVSSAEPTLLAQRRKPDLNILKRMVDFFKTYEPDLYAAGGTSTGLPGPSGGHFVTVNSQTGRLGTFHATPIGKPIDFGVAKLGFSMLGSLQKNPGDEGGVIDRGGTSVTLTVPGKIFLLASFVSTVPAVSNFSRALATLAFDPNNQGARELVKGEHDLPVTLAFAFNANALLTKPAVLISPKIGAGLDAAMKATNTNAWVGAGYNSARMKFVDGKPTTITIGGKEHDIGEMIKNFSQPSPNRVEYDRFGIPL